MEVFPTFINPTYKILAILGIPHKDNDAMGVLVALSLRDLQKAAYLGSRLLFHILHLYKTVSGYGY